MAPLTLPATSLITPAPATLPAPAKAPLSAPPHSASSTQNKLLPTLIFRGSEQRLRAIPSAPIADAGTTLDTPLPPDFPSAELFASALTRHAIETLHGVRPIGQLQSWFTPALFKAFTRRVALMAGETGYGAKRLPASVRRIRCTYPRQRVAEASVIVHDGERLRAVALRLEVLHKRWHVTALEIA